MDTAMPAWLKHDVTNLGDTQWTSFCIFTQNIGPNKETKSISVDGSLTVCSVYGLL